MKFKEEVAKEEQDEGKTGITLYFKQTKDEFNDDEPNVFITVEKNEFLGSLTERWVVKIMEQNIIGSAKINTNDNFNKFDDEVKQ